MAEARQRADWQHTSSVICIIANANRDPKRRPDPFKPADFDPFTPPKVAKTWDEFVKMIHPTYVPTPSTPTPAPCPPTT